jgi:hypothetical protein
VVKDLKTARGPRDMHFSADHTKLDVACADDDVIVIIDVAKLKVVGKLATGSSPETFGIDENFRAHGHKEPLAPRRVVRPAHCGRPLRAAPLHSSASFAFYLATPDLAASIFAFTASRLKLAPFCIGNSIAVNANSSTFCWTKTKRQNSYLNHSK